MNFLFRTFILLGALLVVFLFATLFAPYWIDWKQFTREFEIQATKVIGQPVKVGGDASLRILPLPFISFEALEVGRNADNSPLMTVGRFSLRAELLPFLSGEVRIVEMEMQRPQLNLHVGENGTIAWTTLHETVVGAQQINIEKLTIVDGTAELAGLAQGRRLKISDLDADMAARSVLGPWRINGNAEIEGVSSKFTITTGSFLPDQRSMRVKLGISRFDQPYELEIDGPVRLQNDVLSWDGKFGLKPFSETDPQRPKNHPNPLPVKLEGQFSATPRQIIIPDYRLEVGSQKDPYVVLGDAEIQIRETVFFNVNADGRQINLDELETASSSVKPLPERRLDAVRSVLERIPVPRAEGKIRMRLPAVVAGDTYIRDLRAIVRPYDAGWEVKELAATLPGNTQLEARGRIGLFDDFGFAGNLLVASRQPSGFAAWLSGDVSPQIRRLRTAGFEATATISPRQMTFNDLELRLDDAILTGKLQRLAGSGRPAIIAEFQGNRVNTEDLRALYSLARGQSQGDLVSHDLNISLKARKLESVLLDVPIEALDVDGQIQVSDGSVSVERFSAGNLFGAQVTSEGRIENVLASPNGNIRLAVSAIDGTGILSFAEKFVGTSPIFAPLTGNRELAKELSLDIELDSTSRENAIRAVLIGRGEIAGTRFESRMNVDGDLSDPNNMTIGLEAGLSNPLPRTLVRQLGLETVPDILVQDMPGPLKVTSSLEGTYGNELQSTLLVSAPGTSVSANGVLQFVNGSVGNFFLDTTIGSSDLMPWVRLFGVILPFESSVSLPASAKFGASRNDGNFVFKNLDGQVSGNRFAGDLSLRKSDVARPKLEGQIKLSNLDLLTLADTVFGRFAGSSLVDGILTGEDLSFGDANFLGYDANIRLNSEKIAIGGAVSGNNSQLELVMIDGAADINSVRFETLGGQASGTLSLKNTDGTVLASGNFSISGAEFSKVLEQMELEPVARGKFEATGSFEGAGKSISGLISAISGNGFAKLEDASISGIDPRSFDRVLRDADQDGFEVNDTSVSEIVRERVLINGFDLERVEAPYAVSRGEIIFRNVGIEVENTQMIGDLRIDLASNDVNATYAATFEPDHRNAIAGADPEITLSFKGPASLPERTIDASLLEGYLSLRAYENTQRKVETLEALVIEKQRHLRQIAYNLSREQYAVRIEAERQALEAAIEKQVYQRETRRLLEERQRRKEEAERAAAEERQRLKEGAERAAAEKRRIAEEARKIEEARKAEEEAETRRLQAIRRAAQSVQSQDTPNSGIETSPLPRLQPEPPDEVSSDLRDNIIKNLENFLRGE